MDEIDAYARASNQVDESKSIRLSDSVLCFGKMQEHSEANQRWKYQLEEFRQSNFYRESFGVRVEYFPRTYFIGDPPEDPKRPAKSKH